MAENFITDIINSFNSIITGLQSFFITARNFLLNFELGIYSVVFILLFIVFILLMTAIISSPIYITKLLADNKDIFNKIKNVLSKVIGK